MKKGISYATIALVFFISTLASAQETSTTVERRQALGIRISSQAAAVSSSVSYKYFFHSGLAAEGLLSFSDPVAIGVLLEKFKPFGPTGLSWFSGGGAYVGFSGGRKFGLQGVIGLDFLSSSLPINLSIDWKPELNITKQFSFEPAAVGFSARFAF